MDLEKLKALVDLLLAASASDGSIDEEEITVIFGYLDEMAMVEEDFRADLEDYMSHFDIDDFDFDGTIDGLGDLDDDERAAVIALLEMVEEADGVIDLDESDFISRVAAALGASADELDALSVEVMDDEDGIAAPPPLPPGAEDIDVDLDEDDEDEDEDGYGDEDEDGYGDEDEDE